MPVYKSSRFLARTGERVDGKIEGSTRGPRGPKNIKVANIGGIRGGAEVGIRV